MTELIFKDAEIEMNKNRNCVFCGRELGDSWFNVVPDDGEDKYICPNCLWRALNAAMIYSNTFFDGGTYSTNTVNYDTSEQSIMEDEE